MEIFTLVSIGAICIMFIVNCIVLRSLDKKINKLIDITIKGRKW